MEGNMISWPRITWKNLQPYVADHPGKRGPEGSLFRALLYSYMYHKEHEVNRLTIAIECVRYGVAADEALQYIRSN